MCYVFNSVTSWSNFDLFLKISFMVVRNTYNKSDQVHAGKNKLLCVFHAVINPY